MVHLDSSVDYRTNNEGIFRLVFEICRMSRVNIAFFQRTSHSGRMGCKIRDTLEKLLQHLDSACPSVKRIAAIAPKYDLEPSIQANGYHSLLTIFRKCCLKTLDLLRDLTLYKESWLFNVHESHAALEEFVVAMGQLRVCFYYMERLNAFCSEEDLFPDDASLTEDERSSTIALMYEFETLDPECFYGRCLGFQYAPSMCRPLTVINQALACHSRVFEKSSRIAKVASGVLSANVYFRNVEERARQVATVTRECDVDFCQSFWSISDNPALVQLSLLTCPAVAVDSVLEIPFEEFELPSDESQTATVTVEAPKPERYGSLEAACEVKRSVSARLLSAKLRTGQEKFCSKFSCLLKSWKGQKAEEKSAFLIVHLHGGGYVGQSSASHEVYLRDWAVQSDVPILSVDYSLAPRFKAPYQIEEAFFAYCWALKNASLLGSTADRVVIVGDSAGGNLAVGVGLMAAQRGVRGPDAVYPIYACMVIQYRPGPSRMLAIMDPLIPLGILSICLQAYLGTRECSKREVKFDNSCNEEEEENVERSTSESEKPSHLPQPSILSTSPSFDLSRSGSPRDFPPGASSPSSLLLFHRRNDSGFFDSSANERRKRKLSEALGGNDGSIAGGIADSTVAGAEKSEGRVMSESADAEEGDRSDGSSVSSSVGGETADHERVSGVVASYAQLKTFKVSPMARSLRNNPGDSPLISPVLAPDSLLRRLKRIHITACHMDPLLDDSIVFARRLRAAGVDVGLDLVSDLPHGFLNFVMLSGEANRASRRCIGNVVSLLNRAPCSH